MLRKIWPIFLFSAGALAQSGNLSSQVRLIKELMPNATRLGLLFNPSTNIDASIQQVSRETGIRVIKSPAKSIREVTKAVRSLDRYDVDFIILVENRVVTSNNAIKFVVKQAVKKKIPVFSTAGNALGAGAYGQLVEDGGMLRIKINAKSINLFDIQIPENNDKFVVQE